MAQDSRVRSSPRQEHLSGLRPRPTALRQALVPGRRIVPPERFAGHDDDPGNLRTLCFACNSSQSNRTDEEWRAARSGRLVSLGLVDGPKPTRYSYGRRQRVW